MRHREFGLYASLIPDHAQPMPLLISSWASPDVVSEFQADLPAIASLIMQGRDQEEAQETTAGSDIVSDGSRTTTPTTSTSILSASCCDGGPVKASPPTALLPPAIITSCTSSIKKRGARPRSRSFTDNWIRRKDVSSDNNIANQRDGTRISPREAEATASTAAGQARDIAINGCMSRKENHGVGELWANSPWNAASPATWDCSSADFTTSDYYSHSSQANGGEGLEDAGSKSIMRHGRAREWRGDDPGSREIVCTTQVEPSATTSKSPTLDDPGNGGVSPPWPPVLAPAPQRAQFAAWAKFSGSLDERQLSALADKHSSLDLAVSRAAEKASSSARQSGQDAAASRYHALFQQQEQQQQEKETASAGWKEGASGGAGGDPFGLSATNPPAWCFSHGGRTVARDPSGTPSICTTPSSTGSSASTPSTGDFSFSANNSPTIIHGAPNLTPPTSTTATFAASYACALACTGASRPASSSSSACSSAWSPLALPLPVVPAPPRAVSQREAGTTLAAQEQARGRSNTNFAAAPVALSVSVPVPVPTLPSVPASASSHNTTAALVATCDTPRPSKQPARPKSNFSRRSRSLSRSRSHSRSRRPNILPIDTDIPITGKATCVTISSIPSTPTSITLTPSSSSLSFASSPNKQHWLRRSRSQSQTRQPLVAEFFPTAPTTPVVVAAAATAATVATAATATTTIPGAPLIVAATTVSRLDRSEHEKQYNPPSTPNTPQSVGFRTSAAAAPAVTDRNPPTLLENNNPRSSSSTTTIRSPSPDLDLSWRPSVRGDMTTPTVGNFSRPRRPSNPLREPWNASSATTTTTIINNHAGSHPGVWPLPVSTTKRTSDEGSFNFSRPARGRGASVSSGITTTNPFSNTLNTAAASSSIPPPPLSANDIFYDSRRWPGTSTFEGPNHHSHDSPKHIRNNSSLSNPTPLFRPTPTYGRTLDSNNTSIVINFTREPIPWLGDGEPRASVRSQRTLSATHAASFAERSSRVTKGSSITSMYANLDDEPSVEDVMVLYEQGFNDDTEPELDPTDNGHATGPSDGFPSVAETRPDTTMSTYSLRAAAAPAVVANPVQSPLSPNYPPSLNSPTSQPDDDALPIFEARPVPASELDVSEDFPAPMARPVRRASENRDSAKSMGDCEEHAPLPDSPLKESVQAFPQPASAPPVEEDPESRDRYGFKKVNQYITREQYDEWNGEYSQYLERRRTKWVQYMKESGLGTNNPHRFPTAGVKTKRFIRKGIPPEWRGAAWFYYAKGPAILGRHAGLYDQLVKQKAKDLDADIIERDLHRTFPDNIHFRPPGTSTVTGETPDPNNPDDAEPAMISSLRRVLHAFSIYNPKIGYCQSLNFIAGLLLLFVPTEEQCFWLLNVITRTFLPGTHETNLHGSKVDLGVLMTVLHDSMPDLWSKLAGDDGLDAFGNLSRPGTGKSVKKPRVRRGQHVVANSDRLAPITVSMAPWFMSCFIGNLPIETTLRVWDVFFYEGSKTMFRIALAILKVGEDEIKSVEDPMEMFSVVQTMPRRMLDANQLMGTCFKRRNGFGHLSQSTVDSERREMRERDEIEQRRIAALDGTAVATTESPGIEEKKRGLFGRRRRRYTDAGVPI